MNPKARRNTRQRQVILEALRERDWHPTVAEIYEVVRERIPRISMGTVYRNLETLLEMGLVRKVEGGSAGARFDGITERHYHIRCIQCGRLYNIEAMPELSVPHEQLERSGWSVIDQHVELIGRCRQCERQDGSGREAATDAGAVDTEQTESHKP